METALRERVERALGAAVTDARPVEGGYTPASRQRVALADGRTCFVKSATDDATAGFLRDEWRVYSCLEAPFLARVLAWEDDGARPMLILEDLSEAHWPPPWRAAHVERARATLRAIASTPPPPGLPRLDALGDVITGGWARVAADPEPLLGVGMVTRAWFERSIDALVAAEAEVELAGEELLHLDVRSDNLCFAAERTLFIDWNFACVGNATVDVAFWLPSLAMEGGPLPEQVLGDDQPRLAALVSGFFASRCGLPRIERAPRVRQIQRLQLEGALPWATRALRLG